MKDDKQMKGQWADPNKVVCKDCVYRDKTTINLGGKPLPVGVTKSYCEKYDKNSNGKPLEILFHDGDCPYYEKA